MDERISVGRYRVEKVIGKGAMGVVYLAFDPQIERKIALKTIRVQDDSRPEEVAVNRERFLKEAQAAGKLIHPNIVTIFDVFEDSGTLYIAMEYVEGQLLECFCTKPKLLEPEHAIKLVMQGLSALNFAHIHQIVHRDIKPTNLMVVDSGETLKIMDFGVARVEGANLTQTGFVVGTPHYMSPEQIEGKALDGRSDVFSMGVVLYELLSGERPFVGDTISTVIYHILNRAPAPLCTVVPGLPRKLNLVLDKALAKRPEDRFMNAEEFRKALQSVTHELESGEYDGYELSGSHQTRELALGKEPPPILPSPPVRNTRKAKNRMGGRVMLWLLLLCVMGGLAWLGTSEIPRRIAAGESIKKIVSPSHEKLPSFIAISTTPPGAKLFLDGKMVDAVTLAPGDTGKHQVEARLGCLSARTTIDYRDRKKSINMKLLPGPFTFNVKTEPEGASLQVDGEDTGLAAPAGIPRNDCSSFKIKAVLDGWEPVERKVDPKVTDSLTLFLKKAPLKGSLRVISSSGRLLVYEGDSLLGHSGESLELPAGKHKLVIFDRRILGRRNVELEIKAGKTLSFKVSPFSTGRVYLYGKPVNEGKVYVDGAFIDELPLNGVTPLATGGHRFKVVGSEGKVVSFKWNIHRGDQTRVVDFAAKRVETP